VRTGQQDAQEQGVAWGTTRCRAARTAGVQTSGVAPGPGAAPLTGRSSLPCRRRAWHSICMHFQGASWGPTRARAHPAFTRASRFCVVKGTFPASSTRFSSSLPASYHEGRERALVHHPHVAPPQRPHPAPAAQSKAHKCPAWQHHTVLKV